MNASLSTKAEVAVHHLRLDYQDLSQRGSSGLLKISTSTWLASLRGTHPLGAEHNANLSRGSMTARICVAQRTILSSMNELARDEDAMCSYGWYRLQ